MVLLDASLFFSIGISLPGIWPDKLLFWIWLIYTLYLITRYRKSLWAKLYIGLLVALLLVAALPMGMPLIMLQHFAFKKEKSYEAGNLRITESAKNPLAKPYLSVVRNYGLYDKEIAMLPLQFQISKRQYRLSDVITIKELSESNKHQLMFIFERGNVIYFIP